ncbi:MAG TPA: 50S ribosomal protein L5 [Candidatus Paceibacterota bacterium]|nr:50S ribosomal protein L5 [Candidatus Paceibacterota bacterium]
METVKQKEKKSYSTLKAKYGYKNVMASPRLVKVVVASGTGSGIKRNKDHNKLVIDRLAKITGQKPATKSAKKSIASFKIRIGDPIGVMVTLRGDRMYGFLDKLINVAIPRTKDFRGIERKIVDNIGNLTMSIKEHTIFPETGSEDIKDVFGLAITIVTTAKNKAEATDFFELIGIPFKK